MNLFGLTILRTRDLADLRTKSVVSNLSSVSGSRGWWPLIREASTGAWQRNEEITLDSVLTFSAVYACVTLIAGDLAKMPLRLVELDEGGIWTETENPAFTPVLRKPNHFQTPSQFIEWWVVSKLLHGNAYALKERDARGVVIALHLLQPQTVAPLVAPDGSVFYQLTKDELSGLREDKIVPAREIIHDVMVPLFHPLVGVSPITACGLAALQGLQIQTSSESFFGNGSNPGGIILAPGLMSQERADGLKAYWESSFSGVNAGKVAILTEGLTYEPMKVSAVDAQLIEQLKWTAEDVATAFKVPYYLVGGPQPTYNNVEALTQQYYSQCLQTLAKKIEDALDFGLGLLPNKIGGVQYGTEFDVDYLILMDASGKTKAAGEAINGGMAPNEARKKYHGLGPVAGGESPYLQQQYYSLEALARRDAEGPPPATPAPAVEAPAIAEEEGEDMARQWGKDYALLAYKHSLREQTV